MCYHLSCVIFASTTFQLQFSLFILELVFNSTQIILYQIRLHYTFIHLGFWPLVATSNSLPNIVHGISQDNNTDDKHAFQSLKRRLYYLIHKVAINKAVKLQRDKESQKKALDKAAKASAAAIKAAAKKEKCKQYCLIHKKKSITKPSYKEHKIKK